MDLLLVHGRGVLSMGRYKILEMEVAGKARYGSLNALIADLTYLGRNSPSSLKFTSVGSPGRNQTEQSLVSTSVLTLTHCELLLPFKNTSQSAVKKYSANSRLKHKHLHQIPKIPSTASGGRIQTPQKTFDGKYIALSIALKAIKPTLFFLPNTNLPSAPMRSFSAGLCTALAWTPSICSASVTGQRNTSRVGLRRDSSKVLMSNLFMHQRCLH